MPTIQELKDKQSELDRQISIAQSQRDMLEAEIVDLKNGIVNKFNVDDDIYFYPNHMDTIRYGESFYFHATLPVLYIGKIGEVKRDRNGVVFYRIKSSDFSGREYDWSIDEPFIFKTAEEGLQLVKHLLEKDQAKVEELAAMLRRRLNGIISIEPFPIGNDDE